MTYPTPVERRQAFSIVSILAVAAAIGSFFVSAGLGLFLAILAIIFGVLGLLLSFSPRTRGGAMSVMSVILGAAGIIAAIIRLVMRMA
jgi:hypothetical protein